MLKEAADRHALRQARLCAQAWASYGLAMDPRHRLGDHVAARRHIVDGETRVALTLVDEARSAVIGAREWDIVQCADGTRDIAGVVAAAKRRGRHTSETQVRAFFDQLHAAGMLVEGPAQPPTAATTATPASRQSRPLLQLPNYRLRCDGQGTCCRIYPTTTFSVPEASRARGLLPQVAAAGDDESRGFTPRRGAQLLPWQSRAVGMCDGRCSYLDAEGGCRLHALAGAPAKPAGCRLFPLVFVDDGQSVRVSVAPECSCVYRSAAEPAAGEALLEGVATSVQLPAEAWIEPARQRVALNASWEVPHARYVALRQALLAAAAPDIAAQLWALAARLGPTMGPTSKGDEPADVDFAAILSDVAAASPPPSWGGGGFAKQLRRASDEQSRWRSPGDMAVRVLARLAVLAQQPHPLPASAADTADERIYLRLSAFGDLWLREHEPPLNEVFRRVAQRMWLARALRTSSPELARADAAWAHPLALVEAVLRSYGLQAAS